MLLPRRRPGEDLTFALTGLALGAAIAAMGLSYALLPAAVLYDVGGCMSLINGVAAATLVQRLVPDRLRGPVFGVASGPNHLAAAVSSLGLCRRRTISWAHLPTAPKHRCEVGSVRPGDAVA
jgi:hypothetical protein